MGDVHVFARNYVYAVAVCNVDVVVDHQVGYRYAVAALQLHCPGGGFIQHEVAQGNIAAIKGVNDVVSHALSFAYSVARVEHPVFQRELLGRVVDAAVLCFVRIIRALTVQFAGTAYAPIVHRVRLYQGGVHDVLVQIVICGNGELRAFVDVKSDVRKHRDSARIVSAAAHDDRSAQSGSLGNRRVDGALICLGRSGSACAEGANIQSVDCGAGGEIVVEIDVAHMVPAFVQHVFAPVNIVEGVFGAVVACAQQGGKADDDEQKRDKFLHIISIPHLIKGVNTHLHRPL